MYNPLFIHGAAGLGKTHLLHAIGHRISARKSGERVVYTTGTRFCDEFNDAIEFTSQRNFYRRYRRADVLLIDDIQCLAGNASAQEEFLDTFNAIFASYGQIVISSDRPPDMTKV